MRACLVMCEFESVCDSEKMHVCVCQKVRESVCLCVGGRERGSVYQREGVCESEIVSCRQSVPIV